MDQRRVRWRNRAHFYGTAAQIMRRILVDHARARGAEKRGAGWERVPFIEDEMPAGANHVDIVALDEALRRFATWFRSELSA